MSDAQLATLLAWLKEQKPVFWKDPHNDSMHRITRIEPQWEEWDGAPLEPALRLSGGQFAALCNVEADDIVFIVSAFAAEKESAAV